LDLNADNTATPTANKGALALPRVSLASNTAQLNGTTPITGMLVYNTNTTLGVGIYFYNGSNWVPIDGDGVIGNEVTDATANRGLVRAGSGNTSSPYTLGIAAHGVDTSMLSGPLDGSKELLGFINGTPKIFRTVTSYNVAATIAPNAIRIDSLKSLTASDLFCTPYLEEGISSEVAHPYWWYLQPAPSPGFMVIASTSATGGTWHVIVQCLRAY